MAADSASAPLSLGETDAHSILEQHSWAHEGIGDGDPPTRRVILTDRLESEEKREREDRREAVAVF